MILMGAETHPPMVKARLGERGECCRKPLKEGLTVSEEKLQVANLRGVNRRIVDFGHAA
jgi:hypothetical protein